MADELRARTAQEFRERNERLHPVTDKKEKEEKIKNELIPDLIFELNQLYAKPYVQIDVIELVRIDNKEKWEIRLIEKWAKSLGYKTKRKYPNLRLMIPKKPKFRRRKDS